jgi:hypothetical protein
VASSDLGFPECDIKASALAKGALPWGPRAQKQKQVEAQCSPETMAWVPIPLFPMTSSDTPPCGLLWTLGSWLQKSQTLLLLREA